MTEANKLIRANQKLEKALIDNRQRLEQLQKECHHQFRVRYGAIDEYCTCKLCGCYTVR